MGQSLCLCPLLLCPITSPCKQEVQEICITLLVARSRSLCGWDQLCAHPLHPVKEAMCRCGSKPVPHAGSH